MTTIELAKDYLAKNAAESGADEIIRELISEAERLRTLLHKLIRKGTDGHWYTSQHGDTDVTYFVGRASLNDHD